MGSQCAQRVVDGEGPLQAASLEDCCHLEGETPIEIRITRQPGRGWYAGPPRGQPPLVMPMVRTAQHRIGPVPEAEKPPMPIGVPGRFPPPATVAHRPADEQGFDGDAFAEPPDSARANPGLMHDPAVLQMLYAWTTDPGHFPEIVRVQKRGQGLDEADVREERMAEEDSDLLRVPM
ncbi:unnamed protein product [Symbiodinium natans]|uniref:Uncharacterized protein n=1 Tax=Symbiodinium natans TaxID=878477 RepID=A0A812I9L6_9DINO|nr:unnamed protein product [Symbiodinium natans]